MGCGFGVCGGGVKFFLEKSAAQQLDACRRQTQLVARQLTEGTSERDELEALLPAGGGPLEVRLQEAEKQLALLEEFASVETRVQEARHEVGAAEAEMARAEVDCQRAKEQWQAALVRAGLPRELAPAEVPRAVPVFAPPQAPSPLPPDLSRPRWELARCRQQQDAITARVRYLAGELGRAASAQDPLEQIDDLVSALATAREAQDIRDRLRRRIRRLRKKGRVAARHAGRWRRSRQALLAAAGVSSEEQFRLRATRQLQRIEWEQRRDALGGQIAQGLAGRAAEEELGQLLTDQTAEEVDRRCEELAAELLETRSLLAQAQVRLGETNQKQQTLVADRRLAQRQLELQQVEAELRAAREAWQVRAVTGLLLEQVRIEFEKHHQPETLREASGYLERLTEGHFVRIWTPLGRQELRVDDALGRAWPVEKLSRGTREQLFLSLRLALVALRARQGIELPMVLDDVLVNFDAVRAKAAVGVLRDFAKAGHQLIVFTCHEHVWRMFKTLKLDARRLPLLAADVQEVPPAAKVTEESPQEPLPIPPAKRAPRARKPKAAPAEPVVESTPPPAPEVIDVPPLASESPAPDYELAEYEPALPPELVWEEPAPWYPLDSPLPVEPTPDTEDQAPASPVDLPPANPPETAPESAAGTRGWEVEFEEEWLRDEEAN